MPINTTMGRGFARECQTVSVGGLLVSVTGGRCCGPHSSQVWILPLQGTTYRGAQEDRAMLGAAILLASVLLQPLSTHTISLPGHIHPAGLSPLSCIDNPAPPYCLPSLCVPRNPWSGSSFPGGRGLHISQLSQPGAISSHCCREHPG